MKTGHLTDMRPCKFLLLRTSWLIFVLAQVLIDSLQGLTLVVER